MGGRMNQTVFNSTFETELRILLLLASAKKKAFALERIVSLDFITCYAGNFQLPYLNIQGDNQFMYSELGVRRESVQEAIKSLVTQGLLNVGVEDGYVFAISDMGTKFIRKLKSEYAKQYKDIAVNVIKRFKDLSDLELDRMLHDSAVKSVRGGN